MNKQANEKAMNLLDKIKLLFQGDPEPETEAAAAPAGEQTAQPEGGVQG